MKDLLIQTLTPLGYPIRLQGSLGTSETYPESFFTFWNNETNDDEFYDNEEHSVIWDFDLNFYSTDPELVNTVLIASKRLLKSIGFICRGVGYDVTSDEVTHTGRGMNVLKIEKLGGN